MRSSRKVNCIKQLLLLFTLMGVTLCAAAIGTYQEPADFIAETFSGDVPKVSKIWIKKDLSEKINEIMEHDLGVLRLRYWKKNKRSAWILEEIGKEKPITAGVVVNDNKIENIRVLAFRESRGWEVRYPFFTDQFSDATLVGKLRLDKNIDGISGATLSVKAMEKMARLALLLHQHTEDLSK